MKANWRIYLCGMLLVGVAGAVAAEEANPASDVPEKYIRICLLYTSDAADE